MSAHTIFRRSMTHNTYRPLSRSEVREIDRRAIEEFGLPGVVLMENAGRGAAQIILDILKDKHISRAAIACGSGNNGGDGFVMARHLANAGIDVEIFLAADESRLTGDAAINYHVIRRMGLPIRVATTDSQLAEHLPGLSAAPLIVDALLGTGFSGKPRPPIDRIIRAINANCSAFVVAIDVPSGL